MEKIQFSPLRQWTPAIYWNDSKIAIGLHLAARSFVKSKKESEFEVGVWSPSHHEFLKLDAWVCNYYIFVSIFLKVLLLKLSFWSNTNTILVTKGQEASDIFWICSGSKTVAQRPLQSSAHVLLSYPWSQFSQPCLRPIPLSEASPSLQLFPVSF